MRRWSGRVLFGALLGLIGGILLSELAKHFFGSGVISTLALWMGLAAAVVYAFIRSRPAGLLLFRSTDVLWGVALGAGLRVLEGYISRANDVSFPTLSASTIGAPFPEFLLAGVGGPLLEEYFFRAVMLVTVFQWLRRPVGSIAAGVTALLASSGLFVLLHVVYAPLNIASSAQLLLLAVVCGTLVLLTGRVWGAIVLHVVYNVSFLCLAATGTALALSTSS